jgi:hypothetical protein
LDELRKLHVLLNREASRVQRYLVAPQLHSLTTELGEPNAQLKRLEGVRVAQLTTGVYIVDPLSQLVLHYDASVRIADILEDVKRLLKVSQIG